MRKLVINLGLAAMIILPSMSYAMTAFSPYADITINTHWDNETNSMQPMALDEIASKTGISSYHLAFITDRGQCEPAWAGQYSTSEKWGSKLTDNLDKANVDAIISFGGAAGTDISKYCSVQQLTAILTTVSADYKAKGLDFDIENGSADVNKLMAALEAYQMKNPNMPISFTLPVLPEGLTAQGIAILTAAKDKHLTYSVNIMAMDYGPYYSGDMGEYAIQAATATKQNLQQLYPQASDQDLWQMIKVTPMIGVNDVNIEKFTLANADNLAQWANQTGIKGLSIWSIARDNPCDNKWASPVCSGDNLQTIPYEYSQHFLTTINQ